METDIDYHAVYVFQVQISSIVPLPGVGNPNMWIRDVLITLFLHASQFKLCYDAFTDAIRIHQRIHVPSSWDLCKWSCAHRSRSEPEYEGVQKSTARRISQEILARRGPRRFGLPSFRAASFGP